MRRIATPLRRGATIWNYSKIKTRSHIHKYYGVQPEIEVDNGYTRVSMIWSDVLFN